MGDFATGRKVLVDAHNEQEGKVKLHKSKLGDLEDRFRRNNVKFRGVAETVLQVDHRQYVQQMRSTLLPSVPERKLVVDRAHRLPRPSHLPDNVPRDAIAKIYFFQVKQDLMKFAKCNSPLPDPYSGITLFTDLCQHTIEYNTTYKDV